MIEIMKLWKKQHLPALKRKSLLHRLQIGLERRGFEQMDELEKFSDNVRHFVRYQQPMRQLTLDAFCTEMNIFLIFNK